MAADSDAWGSVLSLFGDTELSVDGEWWGPGFLAKKRLKWTKDETEENQKLCLGVSLVQQGQGHRPLWQLPAAERKKVIASWHADGRNGVRARGEAARRSNRIVSSIRKKRWSPSFWAEDFKEWIDRVVEAISEVAEIRERGVTIPKSSEWAPSGANSELETRVTYGARGFCNYCRRKTTGFTVSKVPRSGSEKAHARYAFYSCGCDEKNIGQCLRCALIDYLDAARTRYGDFRIKDEDGEVIGLKPINCKKSCGMAWAPTSLFLVGEPVAKEGSTN